MTDMHRELRDTAHAATSIEEKVECLNRGIEVMVFPEDIQNVIGVKEVESIKSSFDHTVLPDNSVIPDGSTVLAHRTSAENAERILDQGFGIERYSDDQIDYDRYWPRTEVVYFWLHPEIDLGSGGVYGEKVVFASAPRDRILVSSYDSIRMEISGAEYLQHHVLSFDDYLRGLHRGAKPTTEHDLDNLLPRTPYGIGSASSVDWYSLGDGEIDERRQRADLHEAHSVYERIEHLIPPVYVCIPNTGEIEVVEHLSKDEIEAEDIPNVDQRADEIVAGFPVKGEPKMLDGSSREFCSGETYPDGLFGVLHTPDISDCFELAYDHLALGRFKYNREQYVTTDLSLRRRPEKLSERSYWEYHTIELLDYITGLLEGHEPTTDHNLQNFIPKLT